MRKSTVPLFSLVLVLALLVTFSTVAFAQQARQQLLASLSGAAEVPGPGDPDGSGSATITLNVARGRVLFDISVMNLTQPLAAAHIHQGAAGVEGPIVVPLFTEPMTATAISGRVDADPALIQAILANPANYYVNVHTSDYPAGAIRGQLSLPVTTMPDTGLSSGTLPLIIGLASVTLVVGFILRRSMRWPASIR
jgi:hypothetical protein